VYECSERSHIYTSYETTFSGPQSRPMVVLGWVAVSLVSGRHAYWGVVEHSVYVDASAANRGVGSRQSAADGDYRLDRGSPGSGRSIRVFPENPPSLALHQRLGFRVIGTRERVGDHGQWPRCGADRAPEDDRQPIGRPRRAGPERPADGRCVADARAAARVGRATYASLTLQRAVGVHGTSTAPHCDDSPGGQLLPVRAARTPPAEGK
jgi:hypothetical protein